MHRRRGHIPQSPLPSADPVDLLLNACFLKASLFWGCMGATALRTMFCLHNGEEKEGRVLLGLNVIPLEDANVQIHSALNDTLFGRGALPM